VRWSTWRRLLERRRPFAQGGVVWREMAVTVSEGDGCSLPPEAAEAMHRALASYQREATAYGIDEHHGPCALDVGAPDDETRCYSCGRRLPHRKGR